MKKRYLLDTCTALYLWKGDHRLSSTASEVIADQESELWFHQMSFLEITIKTSLGKLTLSKAPEKVVAMGLKTYDLRFATLKNPEIVGLGDLPWHHRDPFDRLLISFARNEELTVLTPDAKFSSYGLRVLW